MHTWKFCRLNYPIVPIKICVQDFRRTEKNKTENPCFLRQMALSFSRAHLNYDLLGRVCTLDIPIFAKAVQNQPIHEKYSTRLVFKYFCNLSPILRIFSWLKNVPILEKITVVHWYIMTQILWHKYYKSSLKIAQNRVLVKQYGTLQSQLNAISFFRPKNCVGSSKMPIFAPKFFGVSHSSEVKLETTRNAISQNGPYFTLTEKK